MGIYFVSEADIDKDSKDINVAICLAFFIGILGIHRFYLGRRISGLIFWVALFLTAFQALWVIIPLVVIEFIQLIALGGRIDKAKLVNKAAQKLSSSSAAQASLVASSALAAHRPERVISDIIPVQRHHAPEPVTASIQEAVSEEDGIYEVSNIETSVIEFEKHKAVIEPHSNKTWTQRLELPYERRDLRVAQLKRGSYYIYERLAEYIDQGLRREGSSLEELGQRVLAGGYSYYGNILYTVFCIAEGEVTHHYSGGERGYDNSFSYQLLEARTNRVYVEHLKQYASEVASKLPPANEETRLYFRLTKNGLPTVWWDMDGELRDSGRIPNKFIRILNITPPRSTKLYDIPGIRAAIFLHYLKAIAVLEQQYDSVPDWPVRMTTYLGRVFDEKRTYVENPNNFTLLNYILKLSEQAVRDNIPYSRPLDTTKERASIKRTIPRRAAEVILSTIDDLKPLKLSSATLEVLRSQNPTAWKSDLVDVDNASIEQAITLLGRYKQPEVLEKVVREIVRKHSNPRVKLVALYSLGVAGASLNENLSKTLLSLVHPAQIEIYNRIVLQNNKLSLQLVERLYDLTKAPRKQVVLSDEKLAKAHDDHNRAINSVVGYLGEEADEDNVDEKSLSTPKQVISKEELLDVSKDEPVVLTDTQRRFLNLLLESPDGIEASVATELAREQKKMLNGYLQSINKILYGKFEDQVIVQRDGRIVIDTEYVAAVKGLL